MINLYGLIGEKLSHSFSPIIHKNILEKNNIDGSYHLFQVKNELLEDSIRGLKAIGAKGCNVTIPYKKDIIKYLDSTSEEAREIGAVNTIQFKDDKAIGYNTDYFGILKTFEKNNINIQGKRVVVLGTGGAAITAVKFLCDYNAKKIIVVSRDKSKVKDFNKFKNVVIINYSEIEELHGEILINTTPSGMYPNIDNSPIEENIIKNFNVIFDLIFNPMETRLLKYAKANNKIAINGLYMLVSQAIKAQEIWNDIKVKDEIIDNIYNYICQVIKGKNNE